MYFGENVTPQLVLELCDTLNMPKVDDLGKYLGILTIWGISKWETLQYIKDRVLAKIEGWKR